MKVLLWIGNEPNQKALANKIHSIIPLSGIITESRTHKKSLAPKFIIEKIIEKIFLSAIGKAWSSMKTHYNNKYSQYPMVPNLDVENINSEDALEFSKSINPDLIIVSGTRLIKEKMLALKPTIGILNLHTGLSPYIKGGPNCTNWCIATKQFHLIGNTIMWIDTGIDTGNILTTEFTDLNGNETLNELHLKVMEHAHALYIKAIRSVITGNKKSVSQSEIATGTTYFNKDWTLKQRINLIRNYKLLKTFVTSGKMVEHRRKIKIIEL